MDFRRWRHDNTGFYSTNLPYKLLISAGVEEQVDTFPLLWKLKIPTKVAFMVWRALSNRLPSKDNLKKPNVINEEAKLMCGTCQHDFESTQHLFLSCKSGNANMAKMLCLDIPNIFHCPTWRFSGPSQAICRCGFM